MRESVIETAALGDYEELQRYPDKDTGFFEGVLIGASISGDPILLRWALNPEVSVFGRTFPGPGDPEVSAEAIQMAALQASSRGNTQIIAMLMRVQNLPISAMLMRSQRFPQTTSFLSYFSEDKSIEDDMKGTLKHNGSEAICMDGQGGYTTSELEVSENSV